MNNENALRSADCICAIQVHCKIPSAIYQEVHEWFGDVFIVDYVLPGLFTGCFSIDSLSLSTLECFYPDSGCLPILLYHIQGPKSDSSNVQALVYEPDTHRFPPNTSLATIFNELMVDKWNISISYSLYYHSCAPASCTFSQIEHAKSVGGIVMGLISVIGGLSTVLRLIAQQIMNVVHYLFKSNRRGQRREGNVGPVRWLDLLKTGIHTLVNRLYSLLSNLNIFLRAALHATLDRATFERYGRWSTRLYAILLTMSFGMSVSYTVVRPQILTETYNTPSLNSYLDLLRVHSETLRCPCSQISSRYDRFVNRQPVFHEVCQSRFASEE